MTAVFTQNIFRFATYTRFTKATFFLLTAILFGLNANSQVVYAVTSTNNLISFNASTPGTIIATVPLTGTAAGHTIEGIDFRPATGQLYALSYNPANGETQVYRVKASSGTMTAVGTAITLATGMSSIGFDFNPTVDRMRITSATRQNYRMHPDNGTLVATDGILTYASGDPNVAATPDVRAVAYTNSFAGTATTIIYYYDFSLNAIATSAAPNGGSINTVGSSGITVNATTGVDIDIFTSASGLNTAYLAASTSGGNSNLYTLNLSTGASTITGMIGSGVNVKDIAVAINPPPASKLIYAISNGNLISFNSSNTSIIISTVAFSGLNAGQSLVGLDFRPATGELYAMGYNSGTGAAQLYKVNLSSGVATQVAAAVTLATGMTGVGFDFNPTVDRIRVTSASRKNYRLNPNDGTISATDTDLTFAVGDANNAATPNVQAVAYTNSYTGAASTTIYYYDFSLNVLASSTAPNTGAMNTIGGSGVTVNSGADVDMDISSNKGSGTNGGFLLASTNGTSSNLYTINFNTGTATLAGTIASGNVVSEMAVYIAPPLAAKNVFAVQGSNLINFSSAIPSVIMSTVPVTGITAGQTIQGMDFRPATGQLYVMGYQSATGATQIYTVNTSTGVATSVGAAVTLATGMTGIGFDFNPTVDRIRVTSSGRKNYRLNPVDGSISATDTDLTYSGTDANSTASPDVHAVAYTNSYNGAIATTIYYYDLTLDNLATSSAPNTGVLNTTGRTSIITANTNGLDMDIVSDQAAGTNNGFVTATTNGTSTGFYSLNLSTGEMNFEGTIPGGLITEMAVSNINVTLPVTLLEFKGYKVENKSRLEWITQTEINSDHFIVLRSDDGINFKQVSEKINSKAIGGNSNGKLSYDFDDVNPLKGNNYYRLMQVDRDGTKQYSNIVHIKFGNAADIKMFPNPAQNHINIRMILADSKKVTITLLDAAGRSIQQYQYLAQAGMFSQRLNVSTLPAGNYYVRIICDEEILFTQLIQKQ